MINTKRLILRPWTEKDVAAFAKITADPRVMKYSMTPLSRAQSALMVEGMINHFNQYGWGFWAVTLRETDVFIGLIGLEHVAFQAHFTPAVEIGWRLGFEYWGNGYATEGALACLEYGFKTLKLPEIVAFTPEHNMASRRVMEKIGMHHNSKDDFDDLEFPEGHALRRHFLYRKRNVIL